MLLAVRVRNSTSSLVCYFSFAEEWLAAFYLQVFPYSRVLFFKSVLKRGKEERVGDSMTKQGGRQFAVDISRI